MTATGAGGLGAFLAGLGFAALGATGKAGIFQGVVPVSEGHLVGGGLALAGLGFAAMLVPKQ